MPWHWALLRRTISPSQISDSTGSIAPDSAYSHTNTSSSSLVRSPSAASTLKERQQSLIAVPTRSVLRRSRSIGHTNSLRRLIPKRADSFNSEIIKKRASYCEIYVEGYGNGLNEVHIERSSSPETIRPTTYSDTKDIPEPEVPKQPPEPVEMEDTSIKWEVQEPIPEPPAQQNVSTAPPEVQELEAIEVDLPVLQLPGSPSMSRESSTASTKSSGAWSQESSESDTDISTPDSTPNMASLQRGLSVPSDSNAPDLTGKVTGATAGAGSDDNVRIFDEGTELPTIHFNSKTWDALSAVS